MFGRTRLQGSSASRRRGRIAIAISAAVLVIGVFIAIPATATPVKYYTPTISPTCRNVSSTGPLAITLANNMAPGGQGFGSAQITIPSGWSVNLTGSSFTFANPSTPRNWSAARLTGTSSSIIQLSSNSSADLVPPQGSVTFSFTATAPSTANPSSTWNTAVKQSNNFLGSGNDFTLNKNPKASQPTVNVSAQCNAAPVAGNVNITGTANVGNTLTGHYTYSDAESDPQGTSTFRWLSDGNAISGATSITYVIQSVDQAHSITFEVTPVASSGTSPGTPVASSGKTVNSAPVANAVSITGSTAVGSTLTGHYTYSDVNSDPEGTSTFRWLLDGNAISGETGLTYVVRSGDQGHSITFEVTPVASTGTSPGVAVASAGVNGNSAPVANNVSISGTPDVGSTLTGTYSYSDTDGDLEGASTFRWLLDGSPIGGETGTTYTVAPSDSGHDITFEVTPVAATGTSPGAAVTSQAVTANYSNSLNCGDSTTLFDGRVTVTNVNGGVNCPPVQFTPTFDGTELNLIKPDSPPVQLKVDVTAWDPEPAQNPVPATIVTPPAPDGEPGVWCDGTPQSYTMPAGHSWCLINQSTQLAGHDGEGTQLMQVTESWLLDGDATLCRCK